MNDYTNQQHYTVLTNHRFHEWMGKNYILLLIHGVAKKYTSFINASSHVIVIQNETRQKSIDFLKT